MSEIRKQNNVGTSNDILKGLEHRQNKCPVHGYL
jgi:hypothetical protein